MRGLIPLCIDAVRGNAASAAAVQALLSAAADPQLCAHDGTTALEAAQAAGHAATAEVLQQVEQTGCWGIGCALRFRGRGGADVDGGEGDHDDAGAATEATQPPRHPGPALE